MKIYIDASKFKDMLLCADALIGSNVRQINELNVFPVPDGDTGTNMSLTFNTAAAELRKRDFESVGKVADCTASALLRGARGNSGVILSLLFRGISKELKGNEIMGSAELANALNAGVEAAYKAVMKPAEGTILTVSRLAAKAAVEAANAGAAVEGVLKCAVDAGQDALEDTQKINPVLKKAGVVDAGGMGYLLMLKAMLASLRGEMEASAEQNNTSEIGDAAAFGVFDTEEITFAFDTVFIVRKAQPDVDLTALRAYLDSIGDSLVIGEDDGSFKVHVHTNIPGDALSEAQKYGTLELAKIENMRTQHDDILAGRKAQSTDDLERIEKELEEQESECAVAAPEKKYGVVTVCAGDGLTALFNELGADRIVTGGQTMNPSTDDILTEINKTPAETVFVFPNNKNIFMAAEQCIPLTGKKVVVMRSKSVAQGISAMLSFNPDNEEEQLKEDMDAAMENVHTAMITYAARDSDYDGHEIHCGEYLALLDGALIGSHRDLETLFGQLKNSIEIYDPEFISIYYGEDVTEAQATEAAGYLSDRFTDAETNVVYGGQPVYYYMISIE
ncbi:MAG: DAK2 domain-containing protein [Eubacteriales bacterium]|nr:DAK2 domain-containing protein [Eubacteriales bacterium]